MIALGMDRLNFGTLANLARQAALNHKLPAPAWQRVDHYRAKIERMLASGRTYYGINTALACWQTYVYLMKN